MKFIGIVGLLVMCLACQDETRENPPLRGNYFVQGNPWKFYFVNEEGRDILSLLPGSKLPTSYLEYYNGEKTLEILPEEGLSYPLDYYSYNGNHNYIGYDADKGMHYWSTSLEGYIWVPDHEFYVGITLSDQDTIRVHYEFDTESCIGGDVCPDPRQVYYNGKMVIRNGEYLNGKEGIVIVKTGF